MEIYYKGRKIDIVVKKVEGSERISGLMFSQGRENLLFEFVKGGRNAIHSCFVFFDFIAIWLDSENNVIEWKVVKPFRVSIKPKREFRKLVEVPLNSKGREILRFLDGKGKDLNS
tara:strand:- start:22846 stop:23190 length:345 start_codon:yes stop_codon:yes gene_type:complete